MIFNKKKFQEIDWSDIELLISNEQEENEHLDYKRELYGNSDTSKKEFLTDVCSFSNGDGGYIIIGIEEKIENGKNSGKPSVIFPVNNIGAELTRLEQILNSGITPKIPSVRFKYIAKPGENNGILIIKISKSWIGPHMVSVDQLNKFWIRKQNSKFPMDYHEIKNSFLMAEKIDENVKSFCDNREVMLLRLETVLSIKEDRSLMLHIIPLSTFGHKLATIAQLKDSDFLLMPLSDDSTSTKINIDGYSRYNVSPQIESYVQVLWDYTHEFADSYVLQSMGMNSDISIVRVGRAVCKGIKTALDNLKRLSVDGPMVVILRMNGLKDVSLRNGSELFEIPRKFDRQRIVVSCAIENETDHLNITGQILETVAHAAGYEGSPYIVDGKWTQS